MLPDLVGGIRTIEKQRCVLGGRFEHVVALEKVELMYRNEAGSLDQIGALNRTIPEPQVRNRDRPCFLRVVNEITLRVIFGLLSNDLYRVLIGAHRSIRSESPEDCAHFVRRLGVEAVVVIDAVE